MPWPALTGGEEEWKYQGGHPCTFRLVRQTSSGTDNRIVASLAEEVDSLVGITGWNAALGLVTSTANTPLQEPLVKHLTDDSETFLHQFLQTSSNWTRNGQEVVDELTNAVTKEF